MNNRNRASGWQYAKLSGHRNEKIIDDLVINDIECQNKILKCAKITDAKIEKISYGGINELNVESVFNDKTKSKTDMCILLSNGKRINISIKKSFGGQVYLIPIHRFIEGFELQYGKEIPKNTKRAIELFWGSAEDTREIINTTNSKYKKYELRKNRLTAETLKIYNEDLYNNLILWFKSNIADIFDFCFSRGLAKNKEDWSDIIWYKNEVGDNDLDTLFNISDLKEKIIKTSDISYGTRTGGTTIQLPFGFVQWHSPTKIIPGSIQFHHKYVKMLEIHNTKKD